MCFYKSKLSKHRKLKTAKKNIPCFKKLTYQNTICNPTGFYSPHQDSFYFEIDQVNPVTKVQSFTEDHISDSQINIGLHSYSTLKKAKVSAFTWNTLFKAVIPKGTRYYYNEQHHEYVSEALTIFPDKS